MRTKMKEQQPEDRINNFDEVALGYTEEEAVKEASHCLQCKNASCVKGCPVEIDIPHFIKLIKERKFSDALKKINEKNMLPAVCGRVCPQENLCEKNCILANKKHSIAIGALERFAADNGRCEIKHEESKAFLCPGNPGFPWKPKKPNGKSVAVVGSGPASITCAAALATLGYKAAIYEALHKAGGVLSYGIPEFRLPKRIVDSEIRAIKELGVDIRLNCLIGKTITVGELLSAHNAVFIGAGAGLPKFMHIEGENLNNVYSANEFLTRVNLMKAYSFPDYATPIKKAKKTVVVGGGNVAMDSARVAKRLGGEVTIIYRRTQEEMPARKDEIKHAMEEGIHFIMLTEPIRILGEKDVEAVECVQMQLIEKDSSGRRKPFPIENSEFKIECDQLIMAIGTNPNPLIAKTTDIATGEKGTIKINEDFQTSIKGVFAAGDITSGSATVIEAIANGRKAANAIDRYQKKENFK